ncbi:hypothetical protein [Catellatospora citrea]|uniref:Uncharacterized protein n=1 Tax=Catellatospora citrea TaxID=53366 RepID=A0A8J3KBK4_9ACTN|nr:hypothetical protein [Catellatospora citrea]RKE05610.1 hypothetical protein C8E86_0414 [Catellatospora citrea]GIF96961.1 hypothetical protein Cci01nite_20550 [Catellatospora citrea]
MPDPYLPPPEPHHPDPPMPPVLDPQPPHDMGMQPPAPDHHLPDHPDPLAGQSPVDPLAHQDHLDQQNFQTFPDPPDLYGQPDLFQQPDLNTLGDGYHPPDPPGGHAAPDPYLAPDPPGDFAAPDPPGFDSYAAPDPPDAYLAPDPPDVYLAPDPPGFDGAYVPPDPPDGDFAAHPPGSAPDYVAPDPPQATEPQAPYEPTPAEPGGTAHGGVSFGIPADLADTATAAPAAQPQTAGDPLAAMEPGKVTWLDRSYDDDHGYSGFHTMPNVQLVPDPSTPGQWLVQVEDPNPPERHLMDHGRDLGTHGMGVVDERQWLTVAVVDSPGGGAPAVGLLRGVDGNLTVVVNTPPGGSLTETTTAINNHLDIYGFAGRPADPQSAPAPPAAPPEPPQHTPPPAPPQPTPGQPEPHQPEPVAPHPPQDLPPPGGAVPPPHGATPSPTPDTHPGTGPQIPPGSVPTAGPAATPPPGPVAPQDSPAHHVPPNPPHIPGHPGEHDHAGLDWNTKQPSATTPHRRKAKDVDDLPTGTGSGPHGADPDGVHRTPGRTSRTVIQTSKGTVILKNAETTLATDPAFRDVAHQVRARMRTDAYGNYKDNLNAAIKKILDDRTIDHPLKKILERRGDQLFWKEGTAFAGQELNYAHTLSQASIRNIGAPEALASAPENLEPVGRRFHLTEYGHKADLVTNHLKTATEEARAATKAGTKDLAVSRIPKGRAGQAGFIDIKGLAFLAILSATGVVILRSSANRTEAVAELVKVGADLALQSIVVRALGSGAGFAVSVVLGMHSDDPHLNRQHAIETAQYDAAHKFIDQYLPQTVTVDKGVVWDSRHYDPVVVEQVHDLMFAVPPTRLPTPAP